MAEEANEWKRAESEEIRELEWTDGRRGGGCEVCQSSTFILLNAQRCAKLLSASTLLSSAACTYFESPYTLLPSPGRHLFPLTAALHILETCTHRFISSLLSALPTIVLFPPFHHLTLLPCSLSSRTDGSTILLRLRLLESSVTASCPTPFSVAALSSACCHVRHRQHYRPLSSPFAC